MHDGEILTGAKQGGKHVDGDDDPDDEETTEEAMKLMLEGPRDTNWRVGKRPRVLSGIPPESLASK